MKHHDRDHDHEEDEGSESGSEEEEEEEEEEQQHGDEEEEEHHGLPPFLCQNPNTPGSGSGLVATLLHTAQLQEWEAFRQEIATARATVNEREVRLAALKQVEETRTRELEVMQTKLRGLQHEFDEARKAAAAPHASGGSSSSSFRTFAGQHAKQMQALQGQVQVLTTSFLPQLEARMSTLSARDAADSKAQAACTAGLERCHALLQASQTAAEAALTQSKRLGEALTRVTQEKEKLTTEVKERTAREANLNENLRNKETLLQEMRLHQSEATQALDKERASGRKKDEEVTFLFSELSTVRARNVDLSFHLNEAAEAREEGLRLRVELDTFKATLREKQEAFQRVSEKKMELEEQVSKQARELEQERRVVRERGQEVGALKKELQESRLLSQLLSRRTAGTTAGTAGAAAAGGGGGAGGGGAGGAGAGGGGQKAKKRLFSRVVLEDDDEDEVEEVVPPKMKQQQQRQRQQQQQQQQQQQHQHQQQQGGREEGKEKEKERGKEREMMDTSDPFFFGEEQEKLQIKAPAIQRKETGRMEGGGAEKQQKKKGKEKNSTDGACKQCKEKPSGLSYLCQLCLQEVCAECVKEEGGSSGASSRGFVCEECQ